MTSHVLPGARSLCWPACEAWMPSHPQICLVSTLHHHRMSNLDRSNRLRLLSLDVVFPSADLRLAGAEGAAPACAVFIHVGMPDTTKTSNSRNNERSTARLGGRQAKISQSSPSNTERAPLQTARLNAGSRGLPQLPATSRAIHFVTSAFHWALTPSGSEHPSFPGTPGFRRVARLA